LAACSIEIVLANRPIKDLVKRAKVLSRKGTILAKQLKYAEAIEALEKCESESL